MGQTGLIYGNQNTIIPCSYHPTILCTMYNRVEECRTPTLGDHNRGYLGDSSFGMTVVKKIHHSVNMLTQSALNSMIPLHIIYITTTLPSARRWHLISCFEKYIISETYLHIFNGQRNFGNNNVFVVNTVSADGIPSCYSTSILLCTKFKAQTWTQIYQAIYKFFHTT